MQMKMNAFNAAKEKKRQKYHLIKIIILKSKLDLLRNIHTTVLDSPIFIHKTACKMIRYQHCIIIELFSNQYIQSSFELFKRQVHMQLNRRL